MSHTVTIKTQFKDEAALAAACKELGLLAPVRGVDHLFAEKNLSGLIVRLPGWQYPVIVNTSTGEAKFDNYNGKWGAKKELDRLTQIYAVHKATIEAKRLGYQVARQPGRAGAIQLRVTSY